MSEDGRLSYDLAHAARRELLIRERKILPRQHDPEEQRWAAEGPCPIPDLDTVRSTCQKILT